MIHIVSPTLFKSKKAFKEAVASNSHIYLDDPAIVNARSGYLDDLLAAFPEAYITVTNHPKRSWFASVEMKNGKVVVK